MSDRKEFKKWMKKQGAWEKYKARCKEDVRIRDGLLYHALMLDIDSDT